MKPLSQLAQKFAQIINDKETMLSTSEQEAQDFLTAFLREQAHTLIFTTKHLTQEMFRQWNDSLPSDTMFSMPEKAQKIDTIQEALQSYMIGNPDIFHYSKNGWKPDRKRFYRQQATVVMAADHLPNFIHKYKAGDLLTDDKGVYAVFVKYDYMDGRSQRVVATVLMVSKDQDLQDETQEAYYMDRPMFQPGSFGGSATTTLLASTLDEAFTRIAKRGEYKLYADGKQVA
jgi:hypothetical protein